MADEERGFSFPPPTPVPAATAPKSPRGPVLTTEQLLGGRVLAWLGGAAVLAGLAFLFALGVSSGWLTEPRRCLLGALAAAGFIAGGVVLQERGGRTTAALAAVGAGIAGLFLAIGFATSAYDLMPALVGAVLAAGVGAFGTTLALRWDSSAVAGLGLVGAVLSPAIAGTIDPGAVVLVWIATASGVAVVVHRRWGWLGVTLAVVAAPQWIVALAFEDVAPGLAGRLLVLVAFGVLGVAAAIGHELRVPAAGLRPSSTFLLASTTLVLSLTGFALIDEVAAESVAIGWLGALAAAHLLAGVAARRSSRITDELALLVLILGTIVADVAFALTLDGAPLAIGWTASTVGFACLARRARGDLDPGVAYYGLGLHVALAAVASFGELQPLTGEGALSVTAGTTLALFAAAVLTSARIADRGRELLDLLGLAALAGLAAMSLDGTALTIAWTAEAVALAAIARGANDPLAAGAAIVHLAGALLWCLADQAQPEGLGSATADLGVAALGLAAVAAASVRLAGEARGDERTAAWAEPLAGLAALLLLYLASLTVVAVHPGSDEEMQGQLQLTALWAATGLAGLVAGLRRDLDVVRVAALWLLALAAGKLFLVDLATLAAAWRVAACIAVGLLLLVAAFVHARLRPEALPDLREKETAFR